MKTTWRDKYTEPTSDNGSCWGLPSNEEILSDYRSFGACIVSYVTALTEHAGWQRVFLVQLFERLISDAEFYRSFSLLHKAGQCADLLMRKLHEPMNGQAIWPCTASPSDFTGMWQCRDNDLSVDRSGWRREDTSDGKPRRTS